MVAIVVGTYIFGLTGYSEYVEIGVGDTQDLSSKGFPGRVLTVKDFRIRHISPKTAHERGEQKLWK
ncbi:MAG: hypothetical protein L5656_11275 [Thermanaeromonas sp.]|nr:hypothetical protein [Thermanaeromonas sp.]